MNYQNSWWSTSRRCQHFKMMQVLAFGAEHTLLVSFHIMPEQVESLCHVSYPMAFCAELLF
jgi:hypothetical protein